MSVLATNDRAGWRTGLAMLAWLLYPAVILFGLRFASPRYVALALLVILLLRQRGRVIDVVASLTWVDRGVLFGLVLLAVTTAATASEALLRFYPVAVNAGMFSSFALSLRFPPSMVERLARLGPAALPEEAIPYTRRVTVIWCAFFVFNGTTAAWLALAASRETWAFYNGFVAYVLMGVLFGVEWLVRRIVMRRNVR